ncbi:MAG: lysylphosphatidylglycerol synthase transmembrane domain-containing protein [Planctomycetota bacterium]|nr:lysylphosphatidylglycerol synthase transmembrane domain-containing protein [Planctomycetota bacterium]
MKSRAAKLLLLPAKCFLAALLLLWVLSQVHWHDWVRDRDGRTYSLLRPAGDHVDVAAGWLWWRHEMTLPTGDLEVISPHGSAGPAYVHDGLASSLRHVRGELHLVGLAVVVTLASYFVAALRWRALLALQDIRVGPWEALRLTFLGMFFNIVVPGTVGGDLVKAYYAAQHARDKGSVLVSVVIDRALGLFMLTLLAGAMLGVLALVRPPNLPDLAQAGLAVGVIAAVVALGMLVLFSSRLRGLLHVQKLYQRLPIAHRISAMGQAVRTYRSRPGGLALAASTSMVSQTLWILGLALLGQSLGLSQVRWYEYFLYIPLIYTIGAIPLTPGGIGFLEKLFLVFFVTADPSQVLALALLARLMPVLLSLPGLVVAVTGAKLPPRDVIAAQLASDEPEAPA